MLRKVDKEIEMSRYVKQIEATGIYGRFDLSIHFERGPNIIYGKNGTGKTTLMHILANALNGQHLRFAFLKFKKIRIRLNDQTVNIERRKIEGDEHLRIQIGRNVVADYPIEILRRFRAEGRLLRREIAREWEQGQLPLFDETSLMERELRSFLEKYEKTGESKAFEPILPTAYFPAFRTMIDAWISSYELRERRHRPGKWTELATESARNWFGEFVPPVNYPSLTEIEMRLSDDIQRARLEIGRADRELLSQGFLDIFASLSAREDRSSDDPTKILESIKILFDRLEQSPLQQESTLITRVYTDLRDSIHEPTFAQETGLTAVRILEVYRNLLQQVVEMQENSFSGIQQYLESVNDFLEGKQLVVDPRIARSRTQTVGISFGNEEPSRGLRSLSSGERQIVTLIYAASHMSRNEVVLIDEPELSLHVDWQRRLLKKMADQIGDGQIIACTHSPIIGADYEDRLKELKPTITENLLSDIDDFPEDEEL